MKNGMPWLFDYLGNLLRFKILLKTCFSLHNLPEHCFPDCNLCFFFCFLSFFLMYFIFTYVVLSLFFLVFFSMKIICMFCCMPSMSFSKNFSFKFCILQSQTDCDFTVVCFKHLHLCLRFIYLFCILFYSWSISI